MRKSSLLLTLPLLGGPLLLAQSVFDDSWTDGDFSDGVDATDTAWYGTTGDSAIEMYNGSLSLRSGTSGRGIHTVFASQSLANVGDSLQVSFTFTTPDTIGVDKNAAFRIGLFNTGGASVAQGGFSSSDAVWNTVYGYEEDFDVGVALSDITFRESLTARTGSKLLGTTAEFTTIAAGGTVYDFFDNTSYTGSFSITRTGVDELTLATTLSIGVTEVTSASATTTAGIVDFDLLAFHVNSSTFGSDNSAGVADNGIDFQNISLLFTVVPEPTTLPLMLGAGMLLALLRRRRAL